MIDSRIQAAIVIFCIYTIMEEQLINFETAELAKKKGFDEKCIWYYCGNQPKLKQINLKGLQNSDFISFISAPTQSLLQKWLREKHNIKVYLIWYDDKLTEPRWSIYVNKTYINGNSNYENALEIGLQEALKLIK